MGHREVEAKIILRSCEELKSIEERLAALGGIPEEVVVEEDLYFQHPCRDFAKTDEALRLRRRSGRVELTYKGPKEGGIVKARREVSVVVDDFEAARELLESLGFSPVVTVRKKRRYYRVSSENAVVTLDEVEDLGCFVEVEVLDGSEERVLNVIRRLGLEDYPRTTLSYLELLLEKKRVH